MTHIRMSGHYDAPIDRVFELATDFRRYPEWNVSYIEVKDVAGPPRQVGTKITSSMRVLGRVSDGTGEVFEIDPPRLLKMGGTRPDGAKLFSTYRFTPKDSGTDWEFEIEYELPAGIVGQIADKLFVERAVERDVRHSIENFTALVEAKQPVLA